jgi:hypothetical protein
MGALGKSKDPLDQAEILFGQIVGLVEKGLERHNGKFLLSDSGSFQVRI